MKGQTRRTLSMAGRVKDFCKERPSDDVGYTALVTRLASLDTEANTQMSTQQAGDIAERAARSRRDTIRQELYPKLRHLVNVAEMAAKNQPELAEQYRMPRIDAPNAEFIAAARRLITAATPHQALFESLGLGVTFFADVTPLVAEFDACTETSHAGRASHVSATAQLIAISREASQIVRLLDGFNRTRFRGDEASLAAWRSAKNVRGPVTKPAAAAPTPPVTPSGGDATKVA